MMVASPKRDMEFLEGQHLSLLEGEALLKGKQTLAVWPLCLAESKPFATIFHFSQEALDKISATYMEV